MSETSPERAGLNEWQANQLRVTLFATPTARPLKLEGWWELVAQSERDRIEDNPKIGRHIEEGSFLGGIFSLTSLANRIDWTLSPIIDPEKGFEEVPKVGPYVSVRDDFLAAILGWLPLSPPIQRLAFGGRLLLPASSKEESYRLLASYLPFSPDPVKSSDLRYQINWPSPSRVQPNLRVNRLRVWASMYSRIQSSAGAVAQGTVVQEGHAVSFEPDINTDAEFMGVLPEDKIADLIRELAGYATELATVGEMP